MTNEAMPQPHKVVRFPIYDKNTNQELNEFLEIDVKTFFEGPRGLARRCRIIQFPDPTPEQEIEILNRLASGLPMIPAGVKLYDVNSLYPTEYALRDPEEPAKEFFSDWYQIPNFDAYEINSGGQVRHRSNKVILGYETLPGKWIRLRTNEGEFQIVSVDDLLNTVFGI
ncbi:HNH endonuclease [Arthrobacter phage Trustiboi]|uniref:HNH endonuclease n=1 Tax=Arthrobacter phage Trustiboi TaxID=2951391 RepID=A0A9E7NGD4_9CAUD|nr:HNH endonuclease [Arthrobacter phage Trustiboi]UTN91632.1 HNH endonuclease [Arthrobacter phage Trustiboi]